MTQEFTPDQKFVVEQILPVFRRDDPSYSELITIFHVAVVDYSGTAFKVYSACVSYEFKKADFAVAVERAYRSGDKLLGEVQVRAFFPQLADLHFSY